MTSNVQYFSKNPTFSTSSNSFDDVEKFGSNGAVSAVVMMLKHCGVKYVGIRTLSVSSLLHGKDIILDYHNTHNE